MDITEIDSPVWFPNSKHLSARRSLAWRRSGLFSLAENKIKQVQNVGPETGVNSQTWFQKEVLWKLLCILTTNVTLCTLSNNFCIILLTNKWMNMGENITSLAKATIRSFWSFGTVAVSFANHQMSLCLFSLKPLSCKSCSGPPSQRISDVM